MSAPCSSHVSSEDKKVPSTESTSYNSTDSLKTDQTMPSGEHKATGMESDQQELEPDDRYRDHNPSHSSLNPWYPYQTHVHYRLFPSATPSWCYYDRSRSTLLIHKTPITVAAVALMDFAISLFYRTAYRLLPLYWMLQRQDVNICPAYPGMYSHQVASSITPIHGHGRAGSRPSSSSRSQTPSFDLQRAFASIMLEIIPSAVTGRHPDEQYRSMYDVIYHTSTLVNTMGYCDVIYPTGTCIPENHPQYRPSKPGADLDKEFSHLSNDLLRLYQSFPWQIDFEHRVHIPIAPRHEIRYVQSIDAIYLQLQHQYLDQFIPPFYRYQHQPRVMPTADQINASPPEQDLMMYLPPSHPPPLFTDRVPHNIIDLYQETQQSHHQPTPHTKNIESSMCLTYRYYTLYHSITCLLSICQPLIQYCLSHERKPSWNPAGPSRQSFMGCPNHRQAVEYCGHCGYNTMTIFASLLELNTSILNRPELFSNINHHLSFLQQTSHLSPAFKYNDDKDVLKLIDLPSIPSPLAQLMRMEKPTISTASQRLIFSTFARLLDEYPQLYYSSFHFPPIPSMSLIPSLHSMISITFFWQSFLYFSHYTGYSQLFKMLTCNYYWSTTQLCQYRQLPINEEQQQQATDPRKSGTDSRADHPPRMIVTHRPILHGDTPLHISRVGQQDINYHAAMLSQLTLRWAHIVNASTTLISATVLQAPQFMHIYSMYHDGFSATSLRQQPSYQTQARSTQPIGSSRRSSVDLMTLRQQFSQRLLAFYKPSPGSPTFIHGDGGVVRQRFTMPGNDEFSRIQRALTYDHAALVDLSLLHSSILTTVVRGSPFSFLSPHYPLYQPEDVHRDRHTHAVSFLSELQSPKLPSPTLNSALSLFHFYSSDSIFALNNISTRVFTKNASNCHEDCAKSSITPQVESTCEKGYLSQLSSQWPGLTPFYIAKMAIYRALKLEFSNTPSTTKLHPSQPISPESLEPRSLSDEDIAEFSQVIHPSILEWGPALQTTLQSSPAQHLVDYHLSDTTNTEFILPSGSMQGLLPKREYQHGVSPSHETIPFGAFSTKTILDICSWIVTNYGAFHPSAIQSCDDNVAQLGFQSMNGIIGAVSPPDFTCFLTPPKAMLKTAIPTIDNWLKMILNNCNQLISWKSYVNQYNTARHQCEPGGPAYMGVLQRFHQYYQRQVSFAAPLRQYVRSASGYDHQSNQTGAPPRTHHEAMGRSADHSRQQHSANTVYPHVISPVPSFVPFGSDILVPEPTTTYNPSDGTSTSSTSISTQSDMTASLYLLALAGIPSETAGGPDGRLQIDIDSLVSSSSSSSSSTHLFGNNTNESDEQAEGHSLQKKQGEPRLGDDLTTASGQLYEIVMSVGTSPYGIQRYKILQHSMRELILYAHQLMVFSLIYCFGEHHNHPSTILSLTPSMSLSQTQRLPYMSHTRLLSYLTPINTLFVKMLDALEQRLSTANGYTDTTMAASRAHNQATIERLTADISTLFPMDPLIITPFQLISSSKITLFSLMHRMIIETYCIDPEFDSGHDGIPRYIEIVDITSSFVKSIDFMTNLCCLMLIQPGRMHTKSPRANAHHHNESDDEYSQSQSTMSTSSRWFHGLYTFTNSSLVYDAQDTSSTSAPVKPPAQQQFIPVDHPTAFPWFPHDSYPSLMMLLYLLLEHLAAYIDDFSITIQNKLLKFHAALDADAHTPPPEQPFTISLQSRQLIDRFKLFSSTNEFNLIQRDLRDCFYEMLSPLSHKYHLMQRTSYIQYQHVDNYLILMEKYALQNTIHYFLTTTFQQRVLYAGFLLNRFQHHVANHSPTIPKQSPSHRENPLSSVFYGYPGFQSHSLSRDLFRQFVIHHPLKFVYALLRTYIKPRPKTFVKVYESIQTKRLRDLLVFLRIEYSQEQHDHGIESKSTDKSLSSRSETVSTRDSPVDNTASQSDPLKHGETPPASGWGGFGSDLISWISSQSSSHPNTGTSRRNSSDDITASTARRMSSSNSGGGGGVPSPFTDHLVSIHLNIALSPPEIHATPLFNQRNDYVDNGIYQILSTRLMMYCYNLLLDLVLFRSLGYIHPDLMEVAHTSIESHLSVTRHQLMVSSLSPLLSHSNALTVNFLTAAHIQSPLQHCFHDLYTFTVLLATARNDRSQINNALNNLSLMWNRHLLSTATTPFSPYSVNNLSQHEAFPEGSPVPPLGHPVTTTKLEHRYIFFDPQIPASQLINFTSSTIPVFLDTFLPKAVPIFCEIIHTYLQDPLRLAYFLSGGARMDELMINNDADIQNQQDGSHQQQQQKKTTKTPSLHLQSIVSSLFLSFNTQSASELLYALLPVISYTPLSSIIAVAWSHALTSFEQRCHYSFKFKCNIANFCYLPLVREAITMPLATSQVPNFNNDEEHASWNKDGTRIGHNESYHHATDQLLQSDRPITRIVQWNAVPPLLDGKEIPYSALPVSVSQMTVCRSMPVYAIAMAQNPVALLIEKGRRDQYYDKLKSQQEVEASQGFKSTDVHDDPCFGYPRVLSTITYPLNLQVQTRQLRAYSPGLTPMRSPKAPDVKTQLELIDIGASNSRESDQQTQRDFQLSKEDPLDAAEPTPEDATDTQDYLVVPLLFEGDANINSIDTPSPEDSDDESIVQLPQQGENRKADHLESHQNHSKSNKDREDPQRGVKPDQSPGAHKSGADPESPPCGKNSPDCFAHYPPVTLHDILTKTCADHIHDEEDYTISCELDQINATNLSSHPLYPRMIEPETDICTSADIALTVPAKSLYTYYYPHPILQVSPFQIQSLWSPAHQHSTSYYYNQPGVTSRHFADHLVVPLTQYTMPLNISDYLPNLNQQYCQSGSITMSSQLRQQLVTAHAPFTREGLLSICYPNLLATTPLKPPQYKYFSITMEPSTITKRLQEISRQFLVPAATDERHNLTKDKVLRGSLTPTTSGSLDFLLQSIYKLLELDHFSVVLKVTSFIMGLLPHLYGSHRYFIFSKLIFHPYWFPKFFFHYHPDVRSLFSTLLVCHTIRLKDSKFTKISNIMEVFADEHRRVIRQLYAISRAHPDLAPLFENVFIFDQSTTQRKTPIALNNGKICHCSDHYHAYAALKRQREEEKTCLPHEQQNGFQNDSLDSIVPCAQPESQEGHQSEAKESSPLPSNLPTLEPNAAPISLQVDVSRDSTSTIHYSNENTPRNSTPVASPTRGRSHSNPLADSHDHLHVANPPSSQENYIPYSLKLLSLAGIIDLDSKKSTAVTSSQFDHNPSPQSPYDTLDDLDPDTSLVPTLGDDIPVFYDDNGDESFPHLLPLPMPTVVRKISIQFQIIRYLLTFEELCLDIYLYRHLITMVNRICLKFWLGMAAVTPSGTMSPITPPMQQTVPSFLQPTNHSYAGHYHVPLAALPILNNSNNVPIPSHQHTPGFPQTGTSLHTQTPLFDALSPPSSMTSTPSVSGSSTSSMTQIMPMALPSNSLSALRYGLEMFSFALIQFESLNGMKSQPHKIKEGKMSGVAKNDDTSAQLFQDTFGPLPDPTATASDGDDGANSPRLVESSGYDNTTLMPHADEPEVSSLIPSSNLSALKKYYYRFFHALYRYFINNQSQWTRSAISTSTSASYFPSFTRDGHDDNESQSHTNNHNQMKLFLQTFKQHYRNGLPTTAPLTSNAMGQHHRHQPFPVDHTMLYPFPIMTSTLYLYILWNKQRQGQWTGGNGPHQHQTRSNRPLGESNTTPMTPPEGRRHSVEPPADNKTRLSPTATAAENDFESFRDRMTGKLSSRRQKLKTITQTERGKAKLKQPQKRSTTNSTPGQTTTTLKSDDVEPSREQQSRSSTLTPRAVMDTFAKLLSSAQTISEADVLPSPTTPFSTQLSSNVITSNTSNYMDIPSNSVDICPHCSLLRICNVNYTIQSTVTTAIPKCELDTVINTAQYMSNITGRRGATSTYDR